ncbi:MAG: DUF2142 domain-containing protein [Deltaproteobacteria bacterium]|nr:DUF2142 domain-containing protein [Deltaproteobacteria bacterium]
MTAQRALLLVCLVFALREPLLWGLTPPLHAPDEAAHFDVVERLEQTHTLPVLNPECVRGDYYSEDARTLLGALVNPVVFHPSVPLPPLSDLKLSETPAARSASGCNYVAIYPPVYYAPAALADTLATHTTFPQRLAAVRASGLVWGLLAVACALLCGLLWLWDARGGLLVGLAVALQPMAGFLFASVSNDGPVMRMRRRRQPRLGPAGPRAASLVRARGRVRPGRPEQAQLHPAPPGRRLRRPARR